MSGVAASAKGVDLVLRDRIGPDDRERVSSLVTATGFFSPEEVAVALELVDERLTRATPSGYQFLFADHGGTTVGYTCFGPVPATIGSFDLYWIVVDPAQQRQSVGRFLIQGSEERMRADGGRRVYAETSSRPQYLPTRVFYERVGYREVAFLPDFYAPGDGKVIYCKSLR